MAYFSWQENSLKLSSSAFVGMFVSKARSVFCRADLFHYLLVSVFFNEKRALKTLERQSKYLYM